MQWREYVNQEAEEVLVKFQTSRQGLGFLAVEEARRAFGWNEIPEERTRWSTVLVRHLRSSFMLLLLSAAALAFFVGEFLEGG